MMTTINKFYDAAAVEPAAAPSIASLMATQGVNNGTDRMVATPIIIQPEIKETTPQANEPEPVAPTNTDSNAETASPEPPPQPQEPIVEPKPQTEVVQPKVQTLQEVLRQHQPEAVLKEVLGDDKLVGLVNAVKGDPKMMAFFSHWQTNGDVKDYLRELTTDYSKMSAEDVMRHQLQQDYPKATQAQLDALYKAKVVRAYNLESEDQDELNEGRSLLEAEADRHRDVRIQKQQEFLLPKPPEPSAAVQDNTEQLRQQAIEEYTTQVREHPYTKNILATNQFSIGEGEEKFNFPVSPDALIKMLVDSDEWAASMQDAQGKPNIEHQLLIAAVAKYGKPFFVEYAKHFKSLGGKAAIAPLENASQTSGASAATSSPQPQTPAEAMAKQGKLV